MAVAKKSVATPDTKTAAKAVDTKAATSTVTSAAPVKTEEVKKEAPKKAEAKKEAPAKKEVAKKEAPKKAEAKKAVSVKKEVAKKEAAPKKAVAKKAPAKKAALKSEVHVQFGGKSYSDADLVKIAQDVWKYDLKQKASDLTSIELYVKPEEKVVYYVMNKDFTGSFSI